MAFRMSIRVWIKSYKTVQLGNGKNGQFWSNEAHMHALSLYLELVIYSAKISKSIIYALCSCGYENGLGLILLGSWKHFFQICTKEFWENSFWKVDPN